MPYRRSTACLLAVLSAALLASTATAQTVIYVDDDATLSGNAKWVEQAKLTAADGLAESWFGGSVSISGDVAVVGAGLDDDAGSQSGSAYVFRWDGTTWLEETKLIASDATAYVHFGDSVSISGDVVVVGAAETNDAGHWSGSAYVFRWDGTTWLEEAKLVASDATMNVHFGVSVSVSGDVVVVGACDLYGGTQDPVPGSAYVFRRNGTTWLEETKFTASDAEAGDRFGVSVSVSVDRVAVGDSAGSVNVFRWNGTDWLQDDKLSASDAATGDAFGRSVSIDGELVVVGATHWTDAGFSSGSAYVFRWDGTTWLEENKLIAPDGALNDAFGSSISTNNNRVLVGAPYGNDAGQWSGSAYVFRWNGVAWTEEAKLVASDAATGDWFGSSVSIDGNRSCVGAMFGDGDAVVDSGSVYVFRPDEPETPQPVLLDFGVTSESVDPDGSFDVYATVQNVGSLGDYGGISISFPELSETDDLGPPTRYTSTWADVATNLAGTTFSTVKYIAAGDYIYPRNELDPVPAKHLLVEGEEATWPNGQTRTLRLTVTPKEPGPLKMRIRAWIAEGGPTGYGPPVYVDPVEECASCELDQQQYWCTVETVCVASPRPTQTVALEWSGVPFLIVRVPGWFDDSYVKRPGYMAPPTIYEDLTDREWLRDTTERMFRRAGLCNINLVNTTGDLPDSASVVYLTDHPGEPFGIEGQATSGYNRYNDHPEGEAVVFVGVEVPNSRELDAKNIAHEIGHLLGLRHIAPDIFVDPFHNSIMNNHWPGSLWNGNDFTNAIETITDPYSGFTPHNHNPVHHLRRFTEGVSPEALAARACPAGTWDLLDSTESPITTYINVDSRRSSDGMIYDVYMMRGNSPDTLVSLAYFASITFKELSQLAFMVGDGEAIRLLAASQPGGEADIVLARGDPYDSNNLYVFPEEGQVGAFLQQHSSSPPGYTTLAQVTLVGSTASGEDCNKNGVPDDEDIYYQDSEDCNHDGTPDECNVTNNDCNHNGTPDECDIAGDTSHDSNFNGVPDECEYPEYVRIVDARATGNNTGLDWSNAYTDLQDALDAASASKGEIAEIWVATGTYTPDRGTGLRTATFQLITGVGLYGGFAGNEQSRDSRDPNANVTVLSGDLNRDDEPDFVNNVDNSYQVLKGNWTDETAVLDGFTITAGNADTTTPLGHGGGMYNSNGSPTVTNCNFIGNSTENYGAGMYNGNDSSPTVTACTFSGNRTKYGGGMYNGADCNPTLTGCTFIRNSAISGAGMSNSHNSPTLVGCAFIENSNRAMSNGTSHPVLIDCYFDGNTGQAGGAIYNWLSDPSFLRCTFTRQRAASGGALYNSSSSPTFVDCEFQNNWTADEGGAIVNVGTSSPTLTGCVFENNESRKGGGINHRGPSMTLTDCIFDGNRGENGGGLRTRGAATLANCIFRGNSATETGGGMCIETGRIRLDNCMFRNNQAEDGGGLFNWSSTEATNCTFSDNSATLGGGGTYNRTNGGLVLTNCIVWNNGFFGLFDGVEASTTVTHSCVQDIHLTPESHNIDDDPMFVPGSGGCYYLSQIAAGQTVDSPGLDTGSDTAANLGLDAVTTRSDEAVDTDIVDMGYHYPITGEPLIMGDFDRSGDVNLADLAGLQNCYTGEGPASVSPCCRIFDFDPPDEDVDLDDYSRFARSFE